jgi:hypothetical protein
LALIGQSTNRFTVYSKYALVQERATGFLTKIYPGGQKDMKKSMNEPMPDKHEKQQRKGNSNKTQRNKEER